MRIGVAAWWLRAAASAGAITAMLWVALYNGYPLVWWDSAAYLESSFLLNVPVSRPVFYGLFMWLAGGRHSLWNVVVLQAVIVVWLVRQVVSACHSGTDPGGVDRALVVISAVLAVATGLPWVAGEVMPDVFAGVAVLSLFLTLRARERLLRGILFAVLLVFALVVHFTNIPLAAGLLVLAAVASRLGWAISGEGLRRAGACVVAAVLLIPATNRVLTGRWFVTDAVSNMTLDRLLAQGIAQKLLTERCPQGGYALCAHQSNLPAIAGRYLWDPQSPFYRVGGWQSGPEAARLARDAIRAYPRLVVQRTAEAFASQLVRFVTFADAERFGEGTGIDYEVALQLPHEHLRYSKARQQQGRLTTAAFRELHWWVAVVSAAVAAFLAVAARRRSADEAVLHLLCVSAVVLNAAVIAAAGSPDDRYASRMMWLLTLAVLVSLLERRSYLAATIRRS